MGLAESQRLLARLATDAALRARFAADPATVAAESGMDPAGSATLAALPIGPLDDFAGSLINKRRGEVGSLLPMTVRALGLGRFAALFRRHALGTVPAGIKKHRDDAVAFAASLAAGSVDPPWIVDLARLESAALLSHGAARRWTALRLRHRPADLARAAASGGPAPGPSPALVCWFRLTPRGRLRRAVLTLPG